MNERPLFPSASDPVTLTQGAVGRPPTRRRTVLDAVRGGAGTPEELVVGPEPSAGGAPAVGAVGLRMSRTRHILPFRPLSRETTPQRRIFARRFRARARVALRKLAAGLEAEMPRWRGTCGWMSW